MNVVVTIPEAEQERAFALLVRHSPGTALPGGTYVIREDAVRALRAAGITVTELSREGEVIEAGRGERI